MPRLMVRALALILFLLAGAFFILWWRALALYPLEQLSAAIYSGETVDEAAISEAMSAASRWPFSSDPALIYHHAIITLYLAETTTGEPTQKKELRQHALDKTTKALQWYPADPFLWTRYAYLLAQVSGRTQAVIDAWRQAVLTAPYVPKLLYWQIDTGLWLRPVMTPEDITLLTRQIRTAVIARRQRQELVRLTYRHRAHALVSPIVNAEDPAYAPNFEREYNRLARKKR